MSYIGRGVDAISNVEKLDNITFSGTTTYALTKSSAAFTPVGANNILISIDGVVQQGNFSVSTTNIVLDWSPTSSNTCNWILHFGTGVLNVPADGSIVAAKMAANSVDSASYVDLSIDTAHLGALQVTGAKLNTDAISAQTALTAEPADTDEFMVSDAGVLKRIDYSLIKSSTTALFSADLSSSQTGITDNAWTKVGFNNDIFDADSVFDTTNNRFIAPSDGKYVINYQVYSWAETANGSSHLASLYKNGSAFEHYASIYLGSSDNYIAESSLTNTSILDLSASDYIEVYAKFNVASGLWRIDGATFMSGYKIG